MDEGLVDVAGDHNPAGDLYRLRFDTRPIRSGLGGVMLPRMLALRLNAILAHHPRMVYIEDAPEGTEPTHVMIWYEANTEKRAE